MAKFLLLYIGGTNPQTEAEQARVLQDRTDWFTRLSAAVVDSDNITPSGHTACWATGLGPSSNC